MKIKQLEKNLQKWVKEKLITSKQAEEIILLERNQKPAGRRFVAGFLTIGVITFLLGVISFIASNWNDLSDTVKLVADFFILMVLGSFSFYFWEKKNPLYFESILLAFLLFCLASIGLISQVYNTGGELPDALLFWSLITFGVVLFSKKPVAFFLWLMGFFFGFAHFLLNTNFFAHQEIITIFVFLPLISAFLTMSSDLFFKNIQQTKVLWGWTLLVFVLSFIYKEVGLTHATLIHGEESSLLDFSNSVYILSYFLAFFMSLYLFFKSSFDMKDKCFLLVFLISFFFPLHMTVLLLGLFSLSLVFLRRGYERLFRYFLIAIQLRFLIFFIIASLGLLSTSLSLMIYGSVFILVSVLWNQYSQAMTEWFKRWAL